MATASYKNVRVYVLCVRAKCQIVYSAQKVHSCMKVVAMLNVLQVPIKSKQSAKPLLLLSFTFLSAFVLSF